MDYRLAYIRLLDDFRNGLDDQRRGRMGIFDLETTTGFADVGAHVYHLDVSGTEPESLGPSRDLNQIWYGISGSSRKVGPFENVSVWVVATDGEWGDSDTSGVAGKVEGTLRVADGRLSIQGIASEGKNNRELPGTIGARQGGFLTPQSILGTGGYWGYGYIFSPHCPSDVNDLGLEVGAREFGLRTLQVKYDVFLNETWDLQLQSCWYGTAEAVRNTGDELGIGYGVQLARNFGVYQRIELEGGVADLDDAGMELYQGTGNEDTPHQVFSRWQMSF